MKYSLSFFLVIALLFSSCNNKVVFKKRYDLPDLFWMKENKLEFKVDFEDIKTLYDVDFLLTHHTVYQYENLLLKLEIITPKGSKLGDKYDFDIRGEDGKFIGSGSGDYWDIDFNLLKNLRLDYPGTYTFTISHNMPMNEVGGIISAGLKVHKVKQKN
jgi:gliding motility-associated lipoprotein GldH